MVTLSIISVSSLFFVLSIFRTTPVWTISNANFGNILYLVSIPVFLLEEALLIWKMSVFSLFTLPLFILCGIFSNIVFSSKNERNVFYSFALTTVCCTANLSIYIEFIDSMPGILMFAPIFASLLLTIIASFYRNSGNINDNVYNSSNDTAVNDV